MSKAQDKLTKWFLKAEAAVTRKQAQKALKKAEKWFKKLSKKNVSE